ncbi:MAG: hypothetical protein EOP29_15920 [Rhodococcus sp. (in: high G+C Gram-positive bacteria)]|nr:MAG: hypothetical protein EOP29_15920 [Rhodococcus sp. (in: high G+C Gram-positive bacteria)]
MAEWAVAFDARLAVPTRFDSGAAVLAGVVAVTAGAALVTDRAESAEDAADIVSAEWVTHAFLASADIAAVDRLHPEDIEDLVAIVSVDGDGAEMSGVDIPVHRLPGSIGTAAR